MLLNSRGPILLKIDTCRPEDRTDGIQRRVIDVLEPMRSRGRLSQVINRPKS
jgi:hypothetical protein